MRKTKPTGLKSKLIFAIIFGFLVQQAIQSTLVLAQPVGTSLWPAPVATPPVLDANGALTLTLPADAPRSETRFRVGIYEHGRPALLHDTAGNFSLLNGRLQVTLRLQAEVGTYDVRLLSNDRARRILSHPAVIVVPGVDREPGWWLANGVPFVSVPPVATAEADVDTLQSTPQSTLSPAAPVILSGLGRDFGRNTKSQSGGVFVPGRQPVEWKTIDLPTLDEIAAPNYDMAGLRAQLAEQIRAAQASGERAFTGFLLPVGSAQMHTANLDDTAVQNSAAPADAGSVLPSLRSLLHSIAPGAALIVEFEENATTREIDAVAALADAVVLRRDAAESSLWPLKVARRVAEEQSHYDLPIFIRWSPDAVADDDNVQRDGARQLLAAFLSGATGIINAGGAAAEWGRIVQRNLPLFVGSVTLEDIGVLPGARDSGARDEATLHLYQRLRGAGRIPLLARLNYRPRGRGVAESFVVALDERISQRTLNDLLTTARSGARLYIEGAPLLDEFGRPLDSRIVTLLGGKTAPINLRRATMELEDPWVFGAARGQKLQVEQRVAVTLREASDEEKATKKGEVARTVAVAARLDDGSPGVIINPVGEGEVVWMPHRVLDEPVAVEAPAPPQVKENESLEEKLERLLPPLPPGGINRSTPLQHFDAAIAGRMQPALVQLAGFDQMLAGPEDVRAAVRSTARGTLLLALFNTSEKNAAVQATVRADAEVALDLASETELPLKTRGFEAQAQVIIAPRGWVLLAFARNREELDKERNAPRLKARWR